MRETDDEVESEGVARARRAWTTADLVLVVLDVSQPLEHDDVDLLRETATLPRLVVANKSDLPPAWRGADLACADPSVVSSKTGDGLDALRASDAHGARGRRIPRPRAIRQR